MTKHLLLTLVLLGSGIIFSACTFPGQKATEEPGMIQTEVTTGDKEVQTEQLPDQADEEPVLPTSTDLKTLEAETNSMNLETETFQ